MGIGIAVGIAIGTALGIALKNLPVFEDLDFIERLRKEGAVVTLPAAVETSSRRFENKSFILTFVRWTILQILYWLGIRPETLLKIYFPANRD